MERIDSDPSIECVTCILEPELRDLQIIDMTANKRDWLAGLLLLTLTVIVYVPAMRGGFIWDDDDHLTQNPCIVGPDGLKEIWTTSAARICPLTLSCFWLQHAVWGLNPFPYHVVNIVLHSLNAVLLWRVLLRLRVLGAWLGAVLWSVHPVQVESVAWITELKNTQSCFFFLATILVYLRWLEMDPEVSRNRRERTYALAVFFAALSISSKSSTVILPITLGLCSWWMSGHWKMRYIFRLFPFFALAFLSSALSIWTTRIEGANDAIWSRGWPERIAIAGDVVWFYIGKLLWPYPLVFIYPRWSFDSTNAASYIGVVAVISVLLFLWWKRTSRLRPVYFAFLFFLTALLPVLGLVAHYFMRYSFVGDHFQYLASMSGCALVAAGIAKLYQQGLVFRVFSISLASLVTLGLAWTTWRHEHVFANNEILWRDTLSKNPSAWMAHNNLGLEIANQGRQTEEIALFAEAFKLNPEFAFAHYNLGNTYLTMGNYDAAVEQYREALRLEPRDVKAYNNLGCVLLLVQGNRIEAIRCFNLALRLKPDYEEAHYNLGLALTADGDLESARNHYKEALRLKPNYIEAHYSLGNLLAAKGEYSDAIQHYKAIISRSPGHIEAHNSLGVVLLNLGQIDAAVEQFQEAIRLNPSHAEAHNNFGMALSDLNRRVEAEAELREAIRIKPDYADAQRNLELLLSQ